MAARRSSSLAMRANLREALGEPDAIVERHVDGVERRPAADRDGAVRLHRQLHADALEERLGQLADACPQRGGRRRELRCDSRPSAASIGGTRADVTRPRQRA